MDIVQFLAELRDVGVKVILRDTQVALEGRTDLLTDALVARIRGHKNEIMDFLRVAQDAPAIISSRSAWPATNACPVSFAQQRLWFLDQFEPGSAFYNIPVAVRLAGFVDIPAFDRACQELVRRHEVLRTTFVIVDGEPRQIIAPSRQVQLSVQDLRASPAAGRDEELQRLLQQEAQIPFDLAKGPLLRVRLFVLAETEHVVALTLHHIVADGWSMQVLVRDLSILYSAYERGLGSPLPELAIQYADFAHWQRQWLQAGELQRQLAYWRAQLEGAPALLELPLDRPRPPVQRYRGAVVEFAVGSETAGTLAALARATQTTFFMGMAAAFNILLSRYSRQDDICIGTPIANRGRAEVEALIGFFSNTLVLRTKLDGKDNFLGLLQKLRTTTLDAYGHQDVPFEQLVEALNPERHTNHAPLFQVALTTEQRGFSPIALPGLSLEMLPSQQQSAKFDLTLTIVEGEEQLHGAFEYNTDLFDRETIERMAGHFTGLLNAIAAAPEARIDTLPMLTEAEAQQLLVEWHQPQAAPLLANSIQSLFEQQAARHGDAVAVVCEDVRLSYDELNRRANRIAHCLRERGVTSGDLVGLCVNRSVEMIVGILGILKAGAAYVPLDPAYPKERLAYMLHDARPKLVLCQEAVQEQVQGDDERHIALLCLDSDWNAIASYPEHNPVDQTDAGDLAYVIYTSGSTGKPKGALLEHRHVLRLFGTTASQFRFSADDSWSLFHSYAFDFSVWEIWGALLHGGKLVIVPQAVTRSPEQFHALLVEEGITILNQTPSAFQQLIHADAAAPADARLRLRQVIFGGEALDAAMLAPWYARHGDRTPQLVNMYGITETTVHVTYLALSSQQETSAAAIGRPLGDLGVLILDAAQNPVPVGVPGELHVTGAGLARGYLNRPDLTAERFVPNPFGPGAGERLYKSGDLARLLPDGNIEYLGRIDQQVKIRGFRIELGEIEAALRALPGVREAAVLAREDQPGDKRLVAYLVADDKAVDTLDQAALRPSLLHSLPDYMVPAHFLMLQAMPLTANGKLDRKALPVPEGTRSEAGYVAPRNELEQTLAAIWAEILKLDRVGIHDNFFALGGHSLMATQVVSQIRARTQTGLPLRALFEEPTVAGLAARLQHATTEEQQHIVPVARDQDLPLSFSQQRQWFLDQFEPGNAFYNIPAAVRLTGQLDIDALQRTLNEIVRRHEALRTTFVAREGVPVQVIAPAVELPLRAVDLSQAPDPQQATAEFLHNEAHTAFDLARGPMIRAALAKLAEKEHVFLLTMHHIVSDGWSIGVLVKEFTSLYAAFSRGLASPLPKLAIQYADFAHWQKRGMEEGRLQRQVAYWTQQLAGAPELLTLPTDRRRPLIRSNRGAVHAFAIPAGTLQALLSLSAHAQATLFMTLQAAFGIVLSRHAGQDDVSVGTFIANRNRAELEQLIGFFVNTLVLRSRIDPNQTFNGFLRQVRDTTLDGYANQDVPFEFLLDALKPARNSAYTPLFQAMLVLQNTPIGKTSLPGLEMEPLSSSDVSANFDLLLECTELDGQLDCAFIYSTELFDATTMETLADQFSCLLSSIVARPDARIDDLAMLDTARHTEVLEQWNDTATPFPQNTTLAALFEEQVVRTPDAIALEFDGQHMSYRELDERAAQLATFLRTRGIGPERVVGISVERSFDMIIGVLGILKSGAAYLPLDPAYPPERLRHMIEDASPGLVLTQSRFLGRLLTGEVPVYALDEELPDEKGHGSHAVPAQADSMAYIIFTSGSTGRPKGIVNTQRNVVNHLLAHSRTCELTGRDRVLQFASLNFDASVEEIFPALLCGSTLVLRPVQFLGAGDAFSAFIEEQRITILDLPTALWHEWTRALARGEASLPDCVRVVIVGGEKALGEELVAWQKLPGTHKIRWLNTYGPTEATVSATKYEAPLRAHEAGRDIPIGKPIANLQCYVLDGSMRPVAPGMAGELYLSGAGLARGYLNRPELTAAIFLPNPFAREAGSRLYKTGDLVRQLPNGELQYLGRADDQVKVRGFRIELDEINTALRSLPQVRDAVTVVREDTTGDKRIVAYVVSGEVRPSPEELRLLLQHSLPDYMLPSQFVHLERLPTNISGKIDRKALPAPGAMQEDQGFVAPRNAAEQELVAIWCQVLRIDKLGVHDNFFTLGGHSLMAVVLLERMRQAGYRIDIAGFFATPTVAALAALEDGAYQPVSVPPNRIPAQCKAITPDMLNLVTLTPEEIAKVSASVGGGAANIQDIYPLAPLQEGILFHHLLGRGGDLYLMPTLLSFDSKPMLDAFLPALQACIARHDILRTSVVWEGLPEPVQVVWRQAPIPVEQLEFDASEGSVADQLMARFDPQHYRIEMRHAPLMRAFITHDAATGGWLLLILAHHLICDHATGEILVDEIKTILQRGEAALPAAQPFRNFVAQARLGVSREEHEAFFSAMLGDVEEPTLPFGLTDVHGDGSGIDEAQLAVDAEVALRLRVQARRLGVGVASLAHVAWAQVLAKVSGRHDVVFGTLLVGRMDSGVSADRMLGMFINTLPLRIKLGRQSVTQCILETHRALTSLLRHEHASLALAQRASKVPVSTPLFSGILNYRHTDVANNEASADANAVRGIGMSVGKEHNNYPFYLSVDDLGDAFLLEAQVPDTLRASAICGYMHHALEGLLHALEQAPQTPSGQIALLGEAESKRLLLEWNGTQAPYPRDLTVVQLFEDQVQRTPDAIAVEYDGEELTYEALNIRANRLAHHLLGRGVGPDVRVGICVERSPEMIVGLLGILKAGGAYVPVDPDSPPERLSYIQEDAQPALLLTQSALLERLPAMTTPVVCLDQSGALEAHREENAGIQVSRQHLAYVIYTSGSTGKPKGVQISHDGLMNYLHWALAAYPMADGTGSVMELPLVFDAAVTPLYLPLLSGKTVELPPASENTSLFEFLRSKRHLDMLKITPAHIDLVCGSMSKRAIRTTVGTTVIGGEALSAAQVRQWMERFPGTTVVNEYGPTETVVGCSIHSLVEPPQYQGGISIGKPIANTQLYILDAQGELVPTGVAGELHIAGAGLARGYLNRPDLTAEKFVPNPYSSEAGARMYRSGDLARYRPDGNIEYLGRIDQQVKIRGYRIELGEIEAVLAAMPQVRDVVVVARANAAGDKELVAHLVFHKAAGGVQGAATEDEPQTGVAGLRGALQRTLPEYMIPAHFAVLENMPLTPNGKVDRRALLELEITVERPDYVAPRNPMEEALAEMMGRVLQREKVGVFDDFFELGGHSITAMQMVFQIGEKFGLDLPLRVLFEFPTIDALAKSIATGGVGAPATSLPKIMPVARDTAFPLSFAQKRFWFLDQYQPGSAFYSLPLALKIDGPFDAAVIERVFNLLVERHEPLRTVFAQQDGMPQQVILPSLHLDLVTRDFSAADASLRDGLVQEHVRQEAEKPFDLAHGPLVRIGLIKCDEHQHIFLLTLHHILYDGWSIGVLLEEVRVLYDAVLNQRPSPLPPLAIQYADYTHWEQQKYSGARLEEQLAYWRNALHGATELLGLPTDRPRQAVMTHRGATYSHALSAGLTQQLGAFARRQNGSLFMVMTAAINILLHRLAGQQDISIGALSANRPAQTESLIGIFVNIITLRSVMNGAEPFIDYLHRTIDNLLVSYENQIPFELVLSHFAADRNASYMPFVQVALNFHNEADKRVSSRFDAISPGEPKGGFNISGLDAHAVTHANFEIQVEMSLEQDRLHIAYEYNSDLFDAGTIVRWNRYLEVLLNAICQDPAVAVGALPVMPQDEYRQVLLGWNENSFDHPRGRSIHQWFEAQAAKTPDAVALVHDARQINYRELNSRSNRLAHHLRYLGVGPDVLAGICAEPSIELIVGMFSILKAGGAYVPIDPAYPKDRLEYMLQDASPAVLLTQECLRRVLPESGIPVIAVDSLGDSLDGYPEDNPVIKTLPGNLAYVIYTSGSTGRPKGAAVQQKGFNNLLSWYIDKFSINASDKVLLISSISFDLTQKNIFSILGVGGQLHLPAEAYSPAMLSDYVQQHAITFLNCAPSAFYPLLPKQPQGNASSIRQVFLGGEPIRAQLLREAYGQEGGAPLVHNTYGPTEASDVVASFTWDVATGTDVIPVGSPIYNTQIYLLDTYGSLVPPGVAGELYIAGEGLARGYLYRPGLTAEKFVPNPFSAEPGARMYKSGDLARYLADGSIEYLGRIDNQVKIRGFRIELGEIEAALTGMAEIREAVVLAREDVPGDKRLVAYLVWQQEGQSLTRAQLREGLAQSLPDYMMPAHFVPLDVFPLSPNGKVDRKALPAPDMARGKVGYVAPGTELESQLALIWAEVLRLDRVGIHDNFFEIGGHSLLATQVVSRIQELLGVEMSVRAMFEAPTVSQLSNSLATVDGTVRQAPIVRVPRDQMLPLSFAQQRLWFLQELEGPSPTFNMPQSLRLKGRLNIEALSLALQEIVLRHEILRTRFVVSGGEPCMVIDEHSAVRLTIGDAVEADIESLTNRHARHVFDLANGPLLVADLWRIDENEHVLLLNMHHIVSDGWSLNILLHEWVNLYEALLHKQASPLQPLPLQYADYAWWQRHNMGDAALAGQLNYWVKQLAGAPELLNLPTDYPRPPLQRFVGGGETLVVSPEISERARELCRSTGTSLFMMLISVFALLMSRYSGETDLLIGTVSSNRNRRELEGLVGMFLGNLVLRADLAGQPSFHELLMRMRRTALDAYTNSDIPFERIVDALPLQRDLSRNPLFQVFFNMLNLPETDSELSELEIEGLSETEFHSKFDMTMYVRDTSIGVVFNLVYNRSLFDVTRMQEMLRQFESLLDQVTRTPQASIDTFSLLTVPAKAVLPDPAAVLGDEWMGSVAERFVVRQALHPGATAIVSHELGWTYRELHLQSERIACHLHGLGIGVGDIVAINAERNASLVAAVLGVLKSGAAYMMQDPAYPVEHVKACLEAAPARAWLQVAQAALSPERQAVVDTIPAFLDLRTLDGNAVLARYDGQTLAAPTLTPDDIAVITFTSGSTGKPKAVEGRHGPLTHFLPWLQEKFGFTEQDRFCMLSGLAHDPLQRDMFTSLCLGASLHIPHADTITSSTLAGWMEEQGVSVAHLTPAMSQILADAPEGAELPALRRVFLVGDVLTRRDVQRLQSLAPKVKVVNYYGSTETQRSVSYYEVEHETPLQALREIIPLGSGIPDVQLLLMNAAGRQAGIGEHGEVYMRSANMARGYRADEALTQQRFIVNPFTGNARDRLYRTGDLGRYLPNGMVECLGRADTQVKVRGFRVELGHIESLLGQHGAVREAIVVIRSGANGDRQLVAYVVPNGRAPSVGELRVYLRTSLPDYMQPAAFVFLDSLPLTPNGKVNRGALPAPEFGGDEVAYLAPRTEIEEMLAGIWQELLGLERVGVLDNFFSLGGHSLLGIKLMARIEKAFGCRLPVSQIFLAPSIAALSQRISAGDPSRRMLVPLRPQGEDTPVFLIHPLGGEVSAYADLVAAIDDSHPVYGIQSAMVAGATIEPYDIDTVCAAYVAEIQSVQPEGPYCLGGWSLGGTLALRCAHQLEQRGHAVRWVALLDTAYRAGQIIAPLTLEQHIGNYLDIAAEDILSVYGAEAVALQERMRAYVSAAGAQRLAHMLQHEQESLAQELQFELGIQAYLLRDYAVARGNISLASGFQPDVLDAPIHAFWADRTVAEGVDTSAWCAFTLKPDQSEAHVFPGRHLSFAFGENAREIGALLNRFLRFEHVLETPDKLPRIAANENGPSS